MAFLVLISVNTLTSHSTTITEANLKLRLTNGVLWRKDTTCVSFKHPLKTWLWSKTHNPSVGIFPFYNYHTVKSIILRTTSHMPLLLLLCTSIPFPSGTPLSFPCLPSSSQRYIFNMLSRFQFGARGYVQRAQRKTPDLLLFSLWESKLIHSTKGLSIDVGLVLC